MFVVCNGKHAFTSSSLPAQQQVLCLRVKTHHARILISVWQRRGQVMLAGSEAFVSVCFTVSRSTASRQREGKVLLKPCSTTTPWKSSGKQQRALLLLFLLQRKPQPSFTSSDPICSSCSPFSHPLYLADLWKNVDMRVSFPAWRSTATLPVCMLSPLCQPLTLERLVGFCLMG